MNDSRKMKSKCGGFYCIGVRAFRGALAAMIVPIFLLIPSAALVAQEVGRVAPLNPKYLEYMAQKEAAGLAGEPLVAVPPGAHSKGLLPSRIDFSHLRESAASSGKLKGGSLPSSFDLRANGKVTPVKDQGNCGSCWAHSAIASVESTLMPVVTNLSEQFIIDTDGFLSGPCEGGYELMAIADMAAHGVTAQNLDTYEYWYAANPTPTMKASASTGYRLNSVALIAAGLDSNKNPVTVNVKNCVYAGSAVAIGFYVIESSPCLVKASNGDECYFSNGVTSGGGAHGVAVVGWDDNYPASNFGVPPRGNGAYLIKNSWGTSFGNRGYFWMSYYEPSVNADAYSYNGVDSPSKYDWTYQYDPLGWSDGYGFGTTTAWMANVFRGSPLGQVIRAVSFYTYSPNTSYTVQIYDQCPITANNYPNSPNPVIEPVGGNLLVSESGTFGDAGYNTHALLTPVTVSLGTASSPANFSVVVKLTDPTGYIWPIPTQNPETSSYPDNGAMPCSTVIMGQSYVSSSGGSGTWLDLASYDANTGTTTGFKACLKAFGTAQ
jgi:C1A family cysteine protease